MNLGVFFDVLLVGTSLAPAYYLVRTFLQIYGVEELSMLRYEWIPICLAGFFFAAWAMEEAYFDYAGDFGLQVSALKDATLFASVSAFAFGTARFAEVWGTYVKKVNTKKKMLASPELVPPPLKEQN